MVDIRWIAVFDGETNQLSGREAVLYQGAWWLVTSWNEAPDAGFRFPARAIRLDESLLQPPGENTMPMWIALQPIPTSVLLDHAPRPGDERFEVTGPLPECRIPLDDRWY